MNNHSPTLNQELETEQSILHLISQPATLERGFRLLLLTYQQRLYNALFQILHHHNDTDEVLQNTFIKVYKHIHGFRGDARLYTWLYKIATNECFSFLQKQAKYKSLISIDDDDAPVYLPDNQSYFDAEKAEKLLHDAIALLPEKQKEVFCLRYYQEMPYEEMSALLGTSTGALKASYHHAVKKVEAFIKQHS